MSNSEIDVPLVEELLRGLKNDATVRVIDVKFKRVGAAGDNYTSVVNQILIKYRKQKSGIEMEEESSLFLKTMHSSDDKPLELLLHNIHHNEMQVMVGPLRRMNEILGIPRTAQLLHYHMEAPYFAIMEDLTPLGFSMADRSIGLDLTHASLAIRNLAKFHASSVAVYEETPEYKHKFRKHMYRSSDDCSENFLTTGMSAIATAVSGWDELDSRYGEKLKKLSKVIFSKTRQAFAPIDDEFTVLTHGDCNQLNILFAYDEDQKPCRAAFVDFQYACSNSPGVDLQYFLSSSVSQDVYQHHQQSLIEEYQSVLAETMKTLACRTQIPSLEDIKKMYNDRLFVSVISTCLIEPIIHADTSQVVSIDCMLDNDEEEAGHRYQATSFRKIMTARLPLYDKLGLLNVQ